MPWACGLGLWPTQGDEERLGPATALYETIALSFVIPSVPGFPTSPLSPATTHVVLSKENHTQLTEAATLDRKSGGADLSRRAVEGSALPRTLLGNVFQEREDLCHRASLYPASRTRPPVQQHPPNETRPCEPDPQPAPCAEPRSFLLPSTVSKSPHRSHIRQSAT